MCSEKRQKLHLSLWLSLLSAPTFCYGQRERILWCSPTDHIRIPRTIRSHAYSYNTNSIKAYKGPELFLQWHPTANYQSNAPIKYSKQPDGLIDKHLQVQLARIENGIITTAQPNHCTIHQLQFCKMKKKSPIMHVTKINITTSVFSSDKSANSNDSLNRPHSKSNYRQITVSSLRWLPK